MNGARILFVVFMRGMVRDGPNTLVACESRCDIRPLDVWFCVSQGQSAASLQDCLGKGRQPATGMQKRLGRGREIRHAYLCRLVRDASRCDSRRPRLPARFPQLRKRRFSPYGCSRDLFGHSEMSAPVPDFSVQESLCRQHLFHSLQVRILFEGGRVPPWYFWSLR